MLMYDRTYPCEPVSECRRYVFTAFGRMIDICPPTKDNLCQHIHGTMLQSGIWSCFTNLTGSIVNIKVWGWPIVDITIGLLKVSITKGLLG